jgi:hypothetical protein
MSRSKWEDKIKKDIQKIEECVDWIDLDQNMDRWLALVNAVMKLWVPLIHHLCI